MKKLTSIILALVLVCTCLSALADTTLRVGASPTPHAEILEVAKELLAKQGIQLEIVEFQDYVLPNTQTESGDLDANYFQHVPYLTDFNQNNGTHLVSVAAIHYEPFCVYSAKYTTLADLPKGATIAVPNDGSNEARALLLLQAQGLITLEDGVDFTATVLDVKDDGGYKLVEMEAAQLPRVLPDVDAAVINGNYAIQSGLNIADALAQEDSASISAQTYANILSVKEGNENNEAILALIAALESEEVRAFIEETYSGAVVPVF